MKQNIEIVRGTSNAFEITVTDSDFKPYTLADGEKLLFGIKKKATDKEYIYLGAVTSGADGVYTFNIAPSDTANAECGRHFYDVGLQSGDNYYNIIEPSAIDIVPNITRHGDGA